MEYTQAEILQTIAMTEMEHLDIRTVTLGLSLRDCATDSIETTAARAREKIERTAGRLVSTVDEIGDEIGIRIANKRIAVTPVSILTEAARGNPGRSRLGRLTNRRGVVGVDFIGGYSALVHKGFTRNESDFLDSIPEALSVTERLCGSVNAATTRAGINMDAVARVGRLIKEAAERTRDQFGLACAKFVCFANAVEDNPFMAGAFHGVGEPEAALNVGVSGPGVVNTRSAALNPVCLCTNSPTSSRSFHSNSRAPANWSAAKPRDVWAFRSASSICRWRRRRCPAIRSRTSSKRWALSAPARMARPPRLPC